MTNEQTVEKDIAKAFEELNEGEKTADQLEKMLDQFEQKVDDIMSSDDVKELEKLHAELEEKIKSAEAN